jgi:hypothetical protein
MSRETVISIPSKNDIDGQFKSANIGRTLTLFRQIFKDGTYQFGELTALYNNYQPGSEDYKNWMKDAGDYPTYAQTTIKNIIIEALTAKGAPIPVTISWTESTDKAVKVSYDADAPLYTIQIFGYPQPPNSMLAERRQKK